MSYPFSTDDRGQRRYRRPDGLDEGYHDVRVIALPGDSQFAVMLWAPGDTAPVPTFCHYDLREANENAALAALFIPRTIVTLLDREPAGGEKPA